jgi:ribosomal protein L7/L12
MSHDFESLIHEARRMRSIGADTDDVLAFLREKGCYKLQSIKVLREVEGISLGEAKERVHLSRTWADTREADDKLHEVAERALESFKTPRSAPVTVESGDRPATD